MQEDFEQLLDCSITCDGGRPRLTIQKLTGAYYRSEIPELLPRLRVAAQTHPHAIARIRSAEALALWDESKTDPLDILMGFLTPNVDRDARLAAIGALGHIGPPAAMAVPTLLKLLDDSDEHLRSSVVQALVLIRLTPDVASAVVQSFATSEKEAHYAVRLLSSMGRAVVPQLVRLLRSENASSRRVAVKAMSEIAWAPADAIPDVLNRLTEEGCWNSILDRGRLFSADRRMQSFFWFDEPEAAIAQALQHPQVEVRRLTASLLALWYEPKDATLLPCVTSAAHDADERVREDALRALFRFVQSDESKWESVAQELALAIRDPSVHVRRRVFEYACRWSPPNRAALLATLAEQDPDESLRADAAEALRSAGRDLREKVRDLINAMDGPASLDTLGLQWLRKVEASVAGTAAPCLVARLSQETIQSNRAALAFTLAAICPQHLIIRELLVDADDEVRLATLATLGTSGQSLDELKPLILERHSDDNASVRHEAAVLLWSLDHDLDAYLKVLFRNLQERPLYTCKDRVIFNGAPLDGLREEWPSEMDEILNLVRSHPEALAHVTVQLEDAPRWNLHFLRLNWEVFHHPRVVSEIAESLRGEFLETVASAELLQRIGPEAADAVPQLRSQLHHKYQLYRLHALQVFQQIGPGAVVALGDVVQCLDRSTLDTVDEDQHDFEEVRMEAAVTIGKLMPELHALIPTLKWIADIPYVRNVLAQVAKEESLETVKSILHALARRHEVCLEATNASHSTQRPPTPARDFEAVQNLLTREPPTLRRGAALALGQLRPIATAAIPHLIRLLANDPSPIARDGAIVALGRIGAAAVAPLQELLQSSDWIVRVEAAEALNRTQGLPNDELPLLFDLLQEVDGGDPSNYRRTLAPVSYRRVLEQIRGLLDSRLGEYILIDSHRRLLAPLSLLIQDKDWGLRDCAISNLGRFGRAAAPLLPLVLDAIGDPEWCVRLSVVHTVPRIAPATPEAVAAINLAATDENEVVRRAAAFVLEDWALSKPT